MDKPYRHLTVYERDMIETGLRTSKSQAEIAQMIGRPRSTVTRELQRNRPDPTTTYDSRSALKLSRQRASVPRRPCKLLSTVLWDRILSLLRSRHSPEQISGRLKLEHPNEPCMQASHETIYRYVYVMPKGDLRTEVLEYLRQGRKKRRPRARGVDRRGQITNMRTIKERPLEVENREVPGHWEGDLIKGKANGSAIGTLVERTTRYVLLAKMKACDAETALKAFTRALHRVPEELRKTMTYDRGKEMARHQDLAERACIEVFFADPHAPWQRGTNENTNGLLREYFPKGIDLSKISTRALRKVEKELNERPRKVHGFYTAGEMYRAILSGKPVALGC